MVATLSSAIVLFCFSICTANSANLSPPSDDAPPAPAAVSVVVSVDLSAERKGEEEERNRIVV